MIETRTATGFDIHRYGSKPGPVRLGGVDIPHDHGFDAHSDGDVALHALADAIYGLIADGDIGAHFPPSDDIWKDKDSAFFLESACVHLRDGGGGLNFCDLTIIAEEPKITPHRDAIRARIAAITKLDVSRVSVKATTSEGLGFTGRGEGIAVQATATAQFKIRAD
jgi:2-C-methyl-D-erythritol 4-phosphate cytidylyltransferase/2-C-methyl-D-erythritol 2,4-cyclodiphosphate synthase